MKILLLSIFTFTILIFTSCEKQPDQDKKAAIETLDSIATEKNTFIHPPPLAAKDTLVTIQ